MYAIYIYRINKMRIAKPKLHPTTLTSVKVLDDLHEQFRASCAYDRNNLQKFLNRCMYLYVNDIEFKNKVLNTSDLVVSGSF
jgi:hypothetical protein